MEVLVLGAGQLARMMALAGSPVGFNVCAFDVRTDKVVHPVTQTEVYSDLLSAILEVDVITAEFEHVPLDILQTCQQSGKLYPNSTAIKTGGDRRLEKALLEKVQTANAEHQVVNNRDDFNAALNKLGTPLVLKSALDGYDGKGQWRIKLPEQAEAVWQQVEQFLAHSSASQGVVAEQFVAFKREVSLVGARNRRGQLAFYPLAENIHVDGVLSLSIANEVNDDLQKQAETMFTAIANELKYTGVLAIEFFELDGQLLVNEIAPRVHNSGHWTQQGADTCQFENHLRAVFNLPLGSTQLIRPTAMINILGEDNLPDALLDIASLHLHWYGKEKRPGRKMGHINVSGKNNAELESRLREVAALLDPIKFPALSSYR
ncbi:5-(carboxyamino)imidazole ribonucleotide synthase [Neptunicella sp. SCSIO 80796]|uniref:5-(carboxyamino)imidazole ribonucleotide synthase n=1 Tax=Neptunicella plasticusilytica TaxID=3117012 RepID=UPI003A4E13F1